MMGQAQLGAPAFPPADWSVWITINVSTDIAETFLEKRPAKNEFFHVDLISLWLHKDGRLNGPRKHPLLTGKLPSRNFADHEILGAGAIAYLPIVDQKTVYEKAIETVNSFKFTNSFSGKPQEASGVDIGLHLQINGRDISVQYRTIQPEDGLSEPILAALAVFRRNLPREYGKLFDFLKVPKLASLPESEAKQYAKCMVHNEWMRIDDVPISYGFPAPRESYWKAAREFFPHTARSLAGGCVVSPGSPKSAKVLYCETCRTLEKKWLQENEQVQRSK